MPVPTFFAAIALIGLFEAFAQSSVQWAQRYQSPIHFAYAILFYVAVCAALYVAYNYKGVGVVNALWSGMSIVLMLAIGYFIFEERLQPMEWIGIAFILAGMSIIHICCQIKK